MKRRVVVTGVGLVCGCGIGTEEAWKNLLAGQSGVGPITHFDATNFDCKIAGEVKNFDPLGWVEKKELKKMGRFIQLALAAADFAAKMAGLEVKPDIADATGVYIGSGIGGFDVIERENSKLLAGGPGRISPFFIPATIVNLAAGHVSIRYGARGPNSATATACSASAHAIGDAFKLIQRGDADVMICGGTEAAITPMGIGGFAAMRALSQRNDDPARSSRPWDKHRDGFVVGEGAAQDHARREHGEERRGDRLADDTRLLHNTRRLTQPWKTGLPIDWTPAEKSYGIPLLGPVMRLRHRLFGPHGLLGKYLRHPDRNQERFFFGLVRECLDQGLLTEQQLRQEMAKNHLRHDAFELLDRTPKLAA